MIEDGEGSGGIFGNIACSLGLGKRVGRPHIESPELEPSMLKGTR